MIFRVFAQYPVEADAHIGPLESYEFSADFRKNGVFCRCDVGIAPYNWRIGALPPVLAVHVR